MSRKNKAYIIIAHYYVPAAGEQTHQKNWGEHGNYRMMEEIYFVTRVRKRWWTQATTILNMTDRKIEKNSSGTPEYNKIIQHVMIKYPEQYNQFVDECKAEGIINKGEE